MKQYVYRIIASTLLLKRRLINKLLRPILQRVRNVSSLRSTELDTNDLSSQQAAQLHKQKISIPVSFTTLLHYRTQQQTSANRKMPDWHINNKITGQTIAQSAGLRIPKNHQKMVSHEDIKLKKNIVIKPYHSAGSSGVFVYRNKDNIWDVQSKKQLPSESKLTNALKTFTDDRWIIEELITRIDKSPVHDLKFYCLYGKVVLILEKDSNGKACFWQPDNTPIDTGKYRKSVLTDGYGVRQKDIHKIEQLSQELPVPFMRIDCLDTGKELVFGEFTPRPGNYHKMNQSADRLLGHEYVAAQQRLYHDLLHGKKFDIYFQSISG